METIASQIVEKRLFGNGRAFIARTGAKDVVTIQGSVLGGPTMLAKAQEAVPAFASRLFDAGTVTHTKDVLRESLAARGASIYFGANPDRTSFFATCLPEDLSFVLKTIAECLGTASFSAKEIETVRTELLGRLKESKTDTRTQAIQELTRLMYDPKHPNYSDKDAATQKKIDSASRKEMQSFQKMLGNQNLIIAIAGDVEAPKALAAIERAFGNLPAGAGEYPEKPQNKKVQAREQRELFIPHKTSIDVFAGHALPINYQDTLYQPFRVVTHLLGGGGFNTYLMRTIRERDGLTYHASARIAGFERDTQGFFRAYVSFAPEMYTRGLATLLQEMRIFLNTGLTEDELAKKKEEMVGEYAIGLSTTAGLASQLHLIGEQDHDLSYIDTYLDEIKAVTVADLKKAAALIDLDKLSISAAGSFVK